MRRGGFKKNISITILAIFRSLAYSCTWCRDLQIKQEPTKLYLKNTEKKEITGQFFNSLHFLSLTSLSEHTSRNFFLKLTVAWDVFLPVRSCLGRWLRIKKNFGLARNSPRYCRLIFMSIGVFSIYCKILLALSEIGLKTFLVFWFRCRVCDQNESNSPPWYRLYLCKAVKV